MIKRLHLTLAAALASATLLLPVVAVAEVKNIVLVHGMNMTGSLWRDVFDQLSARDYTVSVAQMPLTAFGADLAAVERVLDRQDGPVLLVGHSYGGFVLGEAGLDPDVAGLVYIAGFLPDVGETQATLASQFPSHITHDRLHIFADGHFVIEPSAWLENVANGAKPADAWFTAQAQSAGHSAAFTYETKAAAWREKPTWSLITLQDRTIPTELQRQMSERAGATTVDVDSGHLVPMTNPEAVVQLIVKAAQAIE